LENLEKTQQKPTKINPINPSSPRHREVDFFSASRFEDDDDPIEIKSSRIPVPPVPGWFSVKKPG